MVAETRTLLALADCKPDDRVQSRARLNSENVAFLSGLLARGKELDPIVCFREPSQPPRYWNAHGHHRWHAHKQAGRSHIEAEIYPGTMRDAILWSVGCNDDHGLRRNNDDIQHAIRMLLTDAEWGKWTDGKIADKCKVDPRTVGRHREAWERDQAQLGKSQSKAKSRTYIHRSGKKTTINVSNIGKRPEEANGADVDESTPSDLYFADEQADLPKLLKQRASAARKFWRFNYRVSRLDDGDLDKTMEASVIVLMEEARRKEIVGARRKHS